jgi:hypothetical protein
MQRVCRICNQLKSECEFVFGKKTNRKFNHCIECDRERGRVYYAKNREKKLSYQAEYDKQNRDAVSKTNKNKKLKNRYGITLQEYESMMLSQMNRCKICNDDSKKLYVDHCHSSGRVRALLCHNCNAGIGHFRERKDIFENAIKYIEEYSNIHLAVSNI